MNVALIAGLVVFALVVLPLWQIASEVKRIRVHADRWWQHAARHQSPPNEPRPPAR